MLSAHCLKHTILARSSVAEQKNWTYKGERGENSCIDYLAHAETKQPHYVKCYSYWSGLQSTVTINTHTLTSADPPIISRANRVGTISVWYLQPKLSVTLCRNIQRNIQHILGKINRHLPLSLIIYFLSFWCIVFRGSPTFKIKLAVQEAFRVFPLCTHSLVLVRCIVGTPK